MSQFTRRTSKPNKSNLEYITTPYGGWSRCIQGKPTDSECDVLSNCVGYACGRFNEIYNEIKKTSGMKYPYLNCNAENFIERAKAYYPDILYSNDPQPGAIMCWMKGTTSGSDGAGHVAIVEEVIDNNTVITSESAYGGTAWFSKTRTRGNGGWGMSSPYSFRSFMLNPAVEPEEDEWEYDPSRAPIVGDKVEICGKVYTNSKAAKDNGYISTRRTYVTRFAEGAPHPYNTTGDLGWMNAEDVKLLRKKQKTPVIPDPVERDKTKDQIFIGNIILRIRRDGDINAEQIGLCKSNSYYNVLSSKVNGNYTWYQIGEQAWCAQVEGVEFYKAGEDETIKELKAKIAKLEAELKEANDKIAETKEDLTEIVNKL